MQSRGGKRMNGRFLCDCRYQAIMITCGLMDTQLAKRRFAAVHPAEAEAFEHFITQARTHSAGSGRPWTKAKQQEWLRQADAAWRKFVRKHNPDA